MSTENAKKELRDALINAELTKAKELIKILQLEFDMIERFHNCAASGVDITGTKDCFTPRSISNSITSLTQQIIEKKENILKYASLAMLQPNENTNEQ